MINTKTKMQPQKHKTIRKNAKINSTYALRASVRFRNFPNSEIKINSKILARLLTTTIILVITLTSGCFLMPHRAHASSINLQNIVKLTNYEREKLGLSTLTINNILTSAAQAKAQDMISGDYFEHTGPDGRQPWDWIKNAGYSYIFAGENLAIDFRNAEDVMKAWMKSETHKDNIIDSNYSEIGIGVAQGNYKGRQSIIVVQMFGTPDEKTKSQSNSEDNSQLVNETQNSENLITFLRKKSKLFVNVFKNSLFNKFYPESFSFAQDKENNLFFGKEEKENSLFRLQAIFTGLLDFVF